MTGIDIADIITVGIAVFVAIGGFYLNRSGQAQKLISAGNELYDRIKEENEGLAHKVEEHKQEIQRLGKEMNILSAEVAAYRRWAAALSMQVIALGGAPVELARFLDEG